MKTTRNIRRILYFLVDIRLLNLNERNVKIDAKTKFEINWEYTPDRFKKMLDKHDIDDSS